jgi:hypothetical protein
MKTTTLWIIRLALIVQFIGVLAVPSLIAAAEAPRAMWMAEWLRSDAIERAIGVLELRNGRLGFTEQVGQVDWAMDLTEVKRVTTVNDGRALLVESLNGEQFVTTIMESNLTPQSPKKALFTIERAMQHLSTHNR